MEFEIEKERTFNCPEGCFRARFKGIRLESKFKDGRLEQFARMTLEVDVPSMKDKIVTVARNFPPSLERGSKLRKPDHETHLGKMSELILKEEAGGILNWLLEGWAKLRNVNLQLVQTPEQKARTGKLLMSSESPKAFVRECLKKDAGSIMGSADLYAHYQEWCREQAIAPFASPAFTQMVWEEVEVRFGLRFRHDLPDGCSNCMRGERTGAD